MKALIVNWITDHWLLALICAAALGTMGFWARWIFSKIAPIGYQDERGFHHGAKLLSHDEVERQLTAVLNQRWEEDPETRKRSGEFRAALEEWHEVTTDCADGHG